jgi:hypothetical protein
MKNKPRNQTAPPFFAEHSSKQHFLIVSFDTDGMWIAPPLQLGIRRPRNKHRLNLNEARSVTESVRVVFAIDPGSDVQRRPAADVRIAHNMMQFDLWTEQRFVVDSKIRSNIYCKAIVVFLFIFCCLQIRYQRRPSGYA